MFCEKVKSVLSNLSSVDFSSSVYFVHRLLVLTTVGTCPKCKGKKQIKVKGATFICKACGGTGKQKEWKRKYLVTKLEGKVPTLFADEDHVEFGPYTDVYCVTNSKKEASALAKYLNKQEKI